MVFLNAGTCGVEVNERLPQKNRNQEPKACLRISSNLNFKSADASIFDVRIAPFFPLRQGSNNFSYPVFESSLRLHGGVSLGVDWPSRYQCRASILTSGQTLGTLTYILNE